MPTPLTPSTLTYTSLRTKPKLRLALQAFWAFSLMYIVGLLAAGAMARMGISASDSLMRQIAQLGMNIFTYAIIEVLTDVYVLLAYLGLAVLLFMHRSDDWLAISISLMIMAFGMRVTGLGNNLAASPEYQWLALPVMVMAEAGIVLFGWLYPEGRWQPAWLRYLLAPLLLTMTLLYVPFSPLYIQKIDIWLSSGILLAWYASSAVVMTWRYRTARSMNQRQQIRWVLFGMLGPLLWFLLSVLPQVFFSALQGDTMTVTTFDMALRVLGIILFPVFPLSITIAIARYKLFDIDFLLNRALVYGLLTALVAGIFGVELLLANMVSQLLADSQQANLLFAASAVLAGAVFQPTRKALQRFVDRTFFNIKIDYLKTPVGKKFQPGSDTQTQAPLLFSSYQNLELIGKGGMAEVYRAEHPTRNRQVAIKVLLSSLATDEQYRKRFLREANTLAGLEHPHIVRIYDFGVENDLYYMVMEYLNGVSLSAYLKENGQVSLAEALPILREVAGALDYAHAAGLVHRDVKPSNVMLDVQPGVSPRAVLTDFGIAKLSGAHTNITASAVLGTFDYIAPEQIQASAEIDGRADLYALGVMSYQLLTGTLPFRRPGTGALLLAHMSAPPPDARDLVPALPRHTALAIQRAMAKKPEERFATASEFVLALG
jgi:serine/threonine-protein kinase